MTSFSIILATRNRPRLFERALNSVRAQTYPAVEIIVVNDGSGDEFMADYQEIIRGVENRVHFFSLIQRPLGHGSGYALNFGVAQATGDYVGFLDDDDEWSDPDYLARVSSVIDGDATMVDMQLSDQAAFVDGKRVPGPLWIEGLAELLQQDGRRAGRDGAYCVTVDDLLRCHGFCHINTLIVRRALFNQIGGLDENIRYEGDRDFFLRLIDRARAIRYTPGIVSHHRVPDPGKSENESTRVSVLTKCSYQLTLLNKAHVFSLHSGLRLYGRRHIVYTLKKITEDLASQKRYREALFYARLALAGGPTLKWAGYTLLIMVRSLLHR
jgi:glycosyltransferase involved in cell wall biosynthesis